MLQEPWKHLKSGTEHLAKPGLVGMINFGFHRKIQGSAGRGEHCSPASETRKTGNNQVTNMLKRCGRKSFSIPIFLLPSGGRAMLAPTCACGARSPVNTCKTEC